VTISLVVGCSRAVRPPTTVVPQPVNVDSVRADSVRADSARKADSVALVQGIERRRLADSVRGDSIRRAQDSLKLAAPPARPQTVRQRASRQCLLDWSASPPESRASVATYADSSHITFIGGGFVGVCQGQNQTIRADSAEFFESAGVVNLFGNVSYTEPNKISFTAMRANYFTREERLFAEGNVVATQLESGSTFSGQTMEYYRARPGVRNVSRLFAPGRPTIRLTEKIDPLRSPPPPVIITANVMEDLGDSLLFAWGAVTIDRGEIRATSDSSSYDKLAAQARLIRNATVTSRDASRPFKLTGDTIQMFNKERELERVVALHNAVAVNGDLRLTSEKLDMRLVEQRLERAFAFGTGRSRATTPEQDLESDSIAIYMRERRVRELHAIGTARAIGLPDSTKIRSADRDFLEGDTVYARFDTLVAPGDTSSQARIREIESIGNSSSFFQIASRRGPRFAPAINYAKGKTILITFDSTGVRNVRIDSSAFGVFLEPLPDSLDDSLNVRRNRADTTRRVPPPPPRNETALVTRMIPARDRNRTTKFDTHGTHRLAPRGIAPERSTPTRKPQP
jgi:lipopolysaccharide export system protein LptA